MSYLTKYKCLEYNAVNGRVFCKQCLKETPFQTDGAQLPRKWTVKYCIINRFESSGLSRVIAAEKVCLNSKKLKQTVHMRKSWIKKDHTCIWQCFVTSPSIQAKKLKTKIDYDVKKCLSLKLRVKEM